MSSPRPISSHIGKTVGHLANLGKQCRLLQQIDHQLGQLLPPTMAVHIQVANFREGCLVLQADSSAWQARLRFQVPQLQQQLADCPGLGSLQTIKTTTRPQERTAQTNTLPATTQRRLSRETADILRSLAQGGHLDPRLNKLLEHIAELADDEHSC